MTTAFVSWATLKSWLTPLDTNNINNYGIIDPDLLNMIGMYTIPTCFGIIVYFIGKYYDKKLMQKC